MITKEHYALVRGLNLPVSTKFSVEVCRFIRGKPLDKAKRLMEGVIEQKIAVPFIRATVDLGHKKGIGPGRYPVKVSEQVLSMLNAVEANAVDKGLNTDELIVFFASATKGVGRMKSGRQRGRSHKYTNIEIRVKELEKKKEEKKVKK